MKRVVKYAADMSNVLGNYDVPDHDLEPPEYPDEDIEDVDGRIMLDFDNVAVTVNPDMTWDYEDEDYTWAEGTGRGGRWYMDVTPHTDITVDRSSVVEYIDSLIEPMMPSQPGQYYLSGEADLWFDVALSMYEDEVTDYDYTFNYRDSSVNNFKASKLKNN